jgi:hypothetical protein
MTTKGSPPLRLPTVRQCAEHHRISRQAVLCAIEEGRLAATRYGDIWAITEVDCAAYHPARTVAERGRRRGRRPQKLHEQQRQNSSAKS